jgi:hypothetical protein
VCLGRCQPGRRLQGSTSNDYCQVSSSALEGAAAMASVQSLAALMRRYCQSSTQWQTPTTPLATPLRLASGCCCCCCWSYCCSCCCCLHLFAARQTLTAAQAAARAIRVACKTQMPIALTHQPLALGSSASATLALVGMEQLAQRARVL